MSHPNYPEKSGCQKLLCSASSDIHTKVVMFLREYLRNSVDEIILFYGVEDEIKQWEDPRDGFYEVESKVNVRTIC